MPEKKKLLEVKDLKVVFGSGKKAFTAIDGVSFDIYEGETFGLVGESGSGKTTIGRAIIRINEAAGGEILYQGERISGKISKEMDRKVIENIQMIFQDPMASLNERAKVDYIVSEGLYNLHKFKSEAERKEIVSKALLDVGLLPEFASRFPHEFSGGQRQRIGIARALLSAIPQPDPLTERVKKVEVYDPSCHYYETDKPRWIEIEEGHFVLANQEEEEKYQEVLRRS